MRSRWLAPGLSAQGDLARLLECHPITLVKSAAISAFPSTVYLKSHNLNHSTEVVMQENFLRHEFGASPAFSALVWTGLCPASTSPLSHTLSLFVIIEIFGNMTFLVLEIKMYSNLV